MSNCRDNVFELVQLKPKAPNAKECTSTPPSGRKDAYQDLTVNTLSRKNQYEDANPKTNHNYEEAEKDFFNADATVESSRKMANKNNESYSYKTKTAVAASLVMGAVLVVSLLIFITPLSIFNYDTYKAHASYSSEEFQQLSKKLNDLNKSLTLLNEVHKQLALKLDNLSSFTVLNNRMIRSQVNTEVTRIYSTISRVNSTLIRNISTKHNELQDKIRQSQQYVINYTTIVEQTLGSRIDSVSNVANNASTRISYFSGHNITTDCRLERRSANQSLDLECANITVSHSFSTSSVSYSSHNYEFVYSANS